MVNEIYVNGNRVTHEYPRKQFKGGFEIRCIMCKNLIQRKWFELSILQSPYVCKICIMVNNNPMTDPLTKQKHTQILQTNEYRTKLSAACKGDKNGFYGKTHSKSTIKKIKEGFADWRETLSEEEYREWTEKMSVGQQRLRKENPEFYKEIKSNAARISHKSQFENYTPNKIEQIVQAFLTENSKHVFEPSVILGYHQFDFGCKEQRILIEVDGDYWHGNPEFFNTDGSDGKRQLNEIQLTKMKRDVEKTNWAKDHNFTLIRLWEREILNGSFVHKLQEVL